MSVKKGIWYILVANLINLIISLFSGFVLPKFLSIETYSDIKLFQLYITYIGILHLGFSDGMYLQHGGKSVENIDKKEVLEEFKTFKLFQLFITIMAIIISLIIKNQILFLCSLVILPINIGNYLRNLYSSIGEFKKYSRFTNINTLLIFFINIVLLLIIKTDNAYFYIICYVIGYFLYWFVLELENRKIFIKCKIRANKKYFKRDVRSGFFLMIGNFCNVIFTSIDRLFVKNLLGTIKFAYYSFAVSIQNLVEIFIMPISTVMYNCLCKEKNIEKIVNYKYYIIIFSALLLSLFFPAKFVIEIWLPKYQDSIIILLILFLVQYVTVIIKCIQLNLYKADKKQKKYFIIMLVIVILSIILNIVSYYINSSMLSIVLATLVTNIVWFIFGELDLKKYKMTLNGYIFFVIIFISFVLCAIVKNTILGCVIYIVMTIILSFILLRRQVIYIYKEGIKIIKKILKVKK